MKFIEDHTGIKENKVSEIRKQLVNHGLITYENNSITIDWKRIQTFAALQTPLPKHGSNRYAPANPSPCKDWTKIPIKKTKEYRKYQYRNPLRQMEAWEREFFQTLEDMTETEYNEIIHGMGMGTSEPKVGYITIYTPADENDDNHGSYSLDLAAANFIDE